MSLSRITDPTSACVKVAEAKEFLRIRGSTAEDYLFRSFIKVAEDYAENYMKRSIMRQQWQYKLDAIPADDVIELPRGPLATVTSAVSNFSYYDSTNATNAMPTTAYTVDTAVTIPRIYLAYDSYWPTGIRNHRDSINIEYWTGYANAEPPSLNCPLERCSSDCCEPFYPVGIGSGNACRVAGPPRPGEPAVRGPLWGP